MILFVVQVTHRTPGQPDASPMMVTENAAVALTAAFGAEEKGYRMGDGDGVRVFALATEHAYPASSFLSGGGPAPITLVLSRIRNRRATRGWVISWFDPELERTYGKIFASLPVPA